MVQSSADMSGSKLSMTGELGLSVLYMRAVKVHGQMYLLTYLLLLLLVLLLLLLLLLLSLLT